jgi:hypothetical protein
MYNDDTVDPYSGCKASCDASVANETAPSKAAIFNAEKT